MALIIGTANITIVAMGFVASIAVCQGVFGVAYFSYHMVAVGLFNAFVVANGSFYFMRYWRIS